MSMLGSGLDGRERECWRFPRSVDLAQDQQARSVKDLTHGVEEEVGRFRDLVASN